MRVAYRVAYRVLRVWSFVSRAHLTGVKCLFHDGAGRAIFVRHHYGDRERWELPGGGVHRGEPLAAAVSREALEELGADAPAWTEVATAHGAWYARRDDITVFAGSWPGGAARPDPVEIAEVGWFALDDPPRPLGPTTAATLDAVRRSGWRAPVVASAER